MSVRWVSLTVAVLAAFTRCPSVQAQSAPPVGTGSTSWAAPIVSTSPQASMAPKESAPLVVVPSPQPSPVPAGFPAPPYPQLLAPGGDTSPQTAAACANAHPDHFTPFMLGDFVGPVANQFSDVKIAEGESPRPVDRVFYKFNYYNNLNKPRWADPTEPIHNVDLYRHVFGLEKTFLDQRVSFGLRVPFYTLDAEAKDFHLASDPNTGALVGVSGGPGFNSTQFGNVAAIAKGVLWEDRQTGSLISAGATLSFP